MRCFPDKKSHLHLVLTRDLSQGQTDSQEQMTGEAGPETSSCFTPGCSVTQAPLTGPCGASCRDGWRPRAGPCRALGVGLDGKGWATGVGKKTAGQLGSEAGWPASSQNPHSPKPPAGWGEFVENGGLCIEGGACYHGNHPLLSKLLG